MEIHYLDIDIQVKEDYKHFDALPRACCPQPFFRAKAGKKRKREEVPSNRVSAETLPAEQARLLESLAKDTRLREHHETCVECCVQRSLSSPLVPEDLRSGRSAQEVMRNGFVLPRDSAWLQVDIFASPTSLQSKDLVSANSFAAVVMDPPWESKSRGVRYKTCQLDQLLTLPVGELLAPGGLCALWVTNDPKKQAFVLEKLFPEWGLQPCACWTWIKVTNEGEPVLPFGAQRPRLPYEKVLVARKPTDAEARSEDPKDRIFMAVPGAHSQKPFLDEFLPPGPKLEVFARNLRPGWVSWGDEVLLFQDAALYREQGVEVAKTICSSDVGIEEQTTASELGASKKLLLLVEARHVPLHF